MKYTKNLVTCVFLLLLALSLVLSSCDNTSSESTVSEGAVSNTEEDISTPEDTSKPAEDTSKPAEDTSKPTEDTSKPTEDTSKPTEDTSKPHEHSWSDWKVTKAATCTEKGSEERSCTCGEKETKEVKELGHTEVVDKAVEPTCTEKGKTEGKHCSVCNTITVKQTEVAAKGHSFGEWKTVTAASCTKEGKSERTCSCGEKETKTLSKTEHKYTNGICTCGKSLYDGTLSTISGINPAAVYWTNGKTIVYKDGTEYYMINSSGKKLAGPFNENVICSDKNGYAVGWSATSKVVGTGLDWNDEPCDIVMKTTKSSVISPDGKVVFERTCERTESFDETTYNGEYIMNVSEDRIITVEYETYFMGMARNYYTLFVYDMKGNKLAEFENIASHGSYINGKLIIMSWDTIFVVDKNGNTIATKSIYELINETINDEVYIDMEFCTIGEGHNTAYFSNGYLMIAAEGWSETNYILTNESFAKVYVMRGDYVAKAANYGTLVFSKVVENDTVSNGYYLIDVSKCKLDDDGFVVPTKDAALCDKEFDHHSFFNIFGNTEKYILVSTMDGKWGYLSYDGKNLKLYDDAANFSGGFAAVKENDEIYVIDEDLERVSNGLAGYESVSTCGKCVFMVKKDGKYSIAVYTK